MGEGGMTLEEEVKRARRVYIIGNGGSFSNAQHLANDLEGAGVRAHTLNPASLTATANDHGYEYVFSRWVLLHGEPGDLLIALSGSGKSKNIVNAVKAAKLIGMRVYTIFGATEGLDMQASEEKQLAIGHRVMKWLRGLS